MIHTLIVDDEPIARKVLREELEAQPDIEVVAEAGSGEEALREIAGRQPQLVFLDLQMPGMGGFDVVRRLAGGPLPVIVIVTAYDQHAIEAFEAGAIDYLLKPVDPARLVKTLERVRALEGRGAEVAESVARLAAIPEAPGVKVPRKITGRAGNTYFLLDADEVLAFRAEHEMVWIHTARQRFIATQPLHVIEEKLRGAGFQRIHRNAIVNVNHVRKMSALTSNRWLLTLTNGLEFVASKRQAQNVRLILEW
ncbi:MAG TPA: LytTR family DNA-binding domain-containing protein [Bryobacteraceae bacterium]|nr:LytTR family DNA-binding domain-containing protein [Bryobacteraceae bacterium]